MAQAAGLPGMMHALVPALDLNNRWKSLQCSLFAVRNSQRIDDSLEPTCAVKALHWAVCFGLRTYLGSPA